MAKTIHAKQQGRVTASHESGTFAKAMVRRIVLAPHPVLARRADEVDPRDREIVELGHALVATMRAHPACVGLAAPQIGVAARVFAIDVTGHRKARSCAGLVVLANPEIVARSGNIVMREGCLSVPHFTGDVARAERVTVEGFDLRNERLVRIDADGIEARCLLHEIDHLDGYVFLERVLDPIGDLYVRKSYA